MDCRLISSKKLVREEDRRRGGRQIERGGMRVGKVIQVQLSYSVGESWIKSRGLCPRSLSKKK
jgi:hypothetical protein